MESLAVSLIEYASIPVVLSGLYTAYVFRHLVKELKIISYFIFASCIVEIVAKSLWYLGENNLPLLHFYVPFGFALLVWYYKSMLKGFVQARLLDWLIIGFTFFSIVNTLLFEPLASFNSNALTVQSILLIILSIFTFIVLMNDIVKEKDIGLLSSFTWINSGMFIYYLSSLMVFYFGDKFIHYFSPLTNQYLWSLHAFFSMIMYACFVVGLWKSPRV